jgi:outer membrane receptor protein involved in Fe transport
MFEMLRKVPLISISTENEIIMAGKGNFKVLINGRTSALTVGKPSDIFKSLPARLVQRIEVITQPSAKYDGEGVGGIINVIMDQKLIQGYLGGLNFGLGRMNSSTSGNFAIRSNKISISTFLNGFWEYPPNSTSSSRIKSGSQVGNNINQIGDIQNRTNSKVTAFTIGYEIDPLNLLILGTSLKNGENDIVNGLSTSITNLNSGNRSFFTNNNFNSNSSGGSVDLNYERGFKRSKQQLLTFSVNYNKSSNKQRGENFYSSRINFDNNNFIQINHSDLEEKVAQVDYAHPIKFVELSLGAKYTSRDGESNFYPNLPVGNDNVAGIEGNRFINKQEIYALYNSYNIKIKDWGISLGARLEGTDNRANFYSTDTQIDQEYHNLIPSVLFLKKFDNTSSLNFGYTQRVQRPDINLMNPFVNKSDPTFYFTGNPDLDPVTNHTFSLGYSWFKKGFINVGTSYSSARNTIQRVIELRSDSINYSTYYNIGKDRRLDMNLNINYPISNVLNISLNGTVTYADINGSVGGTMYRNDGMQGNAYLYLNYTLKKIARISGNLGFYSPTVILQGSSQGYLYSAFSANKQIFKSKITLSTSVSNLFQKYRTVENRINSPDFEQTHIYKNYFRNYSFSISYNFGKLDKPIKKNKKGIKSDDKIEKTEKAEKGSAL